MSVQGMKSLQPMTGQHGTGAVEQITAQSGRRNMHVDEAMACDFLGQALAADDHRFMAPALDQRAGHGREQMAQGQAALQ